MNAKANTRGNLMMKDAKHTEPFVKKRVLNLSDIMKSGTR